MNPFDIINAAIQSALDSGKPGIRLDELTNVVNKTMKTSFEPEAVDALLIGMSKMNMPIQRIPYRERQSHGVEFDLATWKASTKKDTDPQSPTYGQQVQALNSAGEPIYTYFPLVTKPDPRALEHENIVRNLSAELAKSLGPRNFEVRLGGNGYKTTITVGVRQAVNPKSPRREESTETDADSADSGTDEQ